MKYLEQSFSNKLFFDVLTRKFTQVKNGTKGSVQYVNVFKFKCHQKLFSTLALPTNSLFFLCQVKYKNSILPVYQFFKKVKNFGVTCSSLW